jgi:hypothetical protein
MTDTGFKYCAQCSVLIVLNYTTVTSSTRLNLRHLGFKYCAQCVVRNAPPTGKKKCKRNLEFFGWRVCEATCVWRTCFYPGISGGSAAVYRRLNRYPVRRSFGFAIQRSVSSTLCSCHSLRLRCLFSMRWPDTGLKVRCQRHQRPAHPHRVLSCACLIIM